jgi:hypothetical protein
MPRRGPDAPAESARGAPPVTRWADRSPQPVLAGRGACARLPGRPLKAHQSGCCMERRREARMSWGTGLLPEPVKLVSERAEMGARSAATRSAAPAQAGIPVCVGLRLFSEGIMLGCDDQRFRQPGRVGGVQQADPGSDPVQSHPYRMQPSAQDFPARQYGNMAELADPLRHPLRSAPYTTCHTRIRTAFITLRSRLLPCERFGTRWSSVHIFSPRPVLSETCSATLTGS